jgi:hypothetical protein
MPLSLRRLSLARVLCLLVLAGTFQTALAQDSEALALLKRAASQSNIRIADHAPFRLEARVRLLDDSIDADYVLVWVSAGKWREEITVGPDYSIRIGDGNRVWTDDEGPDAYRVRGAMHNLDMPVLLLPRPTQFVTPITSLEHGGVQLQCVFERSDFSQQEYCVDPQQGLLRAFEGNRDWIWTEYSDYESFEGVPFPRIVQHYTHGNLKSEVIVKRLVREENMSLDSFTPSKDAIERPGCEHPEPPIALFSHPADESEVPEDAVHIGTVSLKGTITVAGRVEDVRVTDPFGSYDSRAIDSASSKHFRPATCDGIPVPSEFHFSVFILNRK